MFNLVFNIINPIIFQYCPFGVLIYTMWGKKVEYKVFEEYKKIKNCKINMEESINHAIEIIDDMLHNIDILINLLK